METVKILEKPAAINWEYDEEADVLYLSIGEPRPAVGVDIGDGITVVGLRSRLLKGLSNTAS